MVADDEAVHARSTPLPEAVASNSPISVGVALHCALPTTTYWPELVTSLGANAAAVGGQVPTTVRQSALIPASNVPGVGLSTLLLATVMVTRPLGETVKPSVTPSCTLPVVKCP